MIKVLPIQSKLTQEEICVKCGVRYDADLLAYAVYNEEVLSGVCQFKLTEKGGVIYDLAPTTDHLDKEALFVVARGALNFIDLCGVHYAVYQGNTDDEALLKRIGFTKNDDGVFDIDLEGFFTSGHCH